MFNNGTDRTGLRLKLTDQFERRIGVVDIVVTQCLALQLFCGGNPGTVTAIGIKRCGLMRVLALA